jgi:hypothetical protein
MFAARDHDLQVPLIKGSVASRNQVHTCAALGDLNRHFAARRGPCGPPSIASWRPQPDSVREDPDRAARADELRRVHPSHPLAGRTPGLARRIDSPRFRRVEVCSPRNILHAFRLTSPEQVGDEFAA